MKKYLGADMARSRSIGETEAECRAFVDLALGRLDVDLQPVSRRPSRRGHPTGTPP